VTHARAGLVAMLALTAPAGVARAEVSRFEIASRADVGPSGYERIVGTVAFAETARQASTDLYILRPKDRAHSNGSVLVDVCDGGAKTAIRRFNLGSPTPDFESEDDLGDRFLMRFGFTIVWVGCRLDPDRDRDALRAAVRDVVSWLKHGKSDIGRVRLAYGYGAAGAAAFLSGFLADELNKDAIGDPVFDGLFLYAPPRGNLPPMRAPQPKIFRVVPSGDPPAGALPDNARVYALAGAPAVPSRFPPLADAGSIPNPVDPIWTLRALMLALHRWASAGSPPPPSGRIELPDVAVPLATYTLETMKPLPRRSIEERYTSRDDYLARVEKAADALVLRRLLLIDDVPRIVQRASDTWDWILDR